MDKHFGTISKIVYGGIILMSLLLIRTYFFNGESQNEADRFYDEGRRLQSDYLYEEAEIQFTNAIESNPRHALAHARRCSVRYQTNNNAGGIEDCTRALQLDPTLTWVYGSRCLLYGELGEFETAIRDCDRALISNPRDDFVLNTLGLLNGEMGDHDLAIENFTTALEIDPSENVFYYNRGLAYRDTDNPAMAITDFEQSVYYGANFFNAHENLVQLLYIKTSYANAVDAATAMIDNFPDRAESYLYRASGLIALENYSSAYDDLSMAQTLNDSELLYTQLLTVYNELDQYDFRAICDYQLVFGDEATFDSDITEWIRGQQPCE